MAKSNSRTVAVCDTGPIIHLDELDSLDLISDFHPLIIPATVQKEIAKHRPKIFQHNNKNTKCSVCNFKKASPTSAVKKSKCR